jgi:hypothetical protein
MNNRESFGHISDPILMNLNGHLHSDYNNNPPTPISFMTPIPGTSGRLHSEFGHLLLLQPHRETDLLFSGFRGSVGTIYQCPVPLPPQGVLLPV